MKGHEESDFGGVRYGGKDEGADMLKSQNKSIGVAGSELAKSRTERIGTLIKHGTESNQNAQKEVKPISSSFHHSRAKSNGNASFAGRQEGLTKIVNQGGPSRSKINNSSIVQSHAYQMKNSPDSSINQLPTLHP
jgi:hypothetical protein